MKIIRVPIPLKTRIATLVSGAFGAALIVELAIGTTQSMWLMIPTAIGFAATFVLTNEQYKKLTREAVQEDERQIDESDEQLRKALIETHKLALSKLIGADDELKDKVIELLIEA